MFIGQWMRGSNEMCCEINMKQIKTKTISTCKDDIRVQRISHFRKKIHSQMQNVNFATDHQVKA